MQAIRSNLSYANVMATLGVFLALGGSAVAFTVGKNTVKSKSIAKGAVKTSDIHNGAVSKAKLKADAIGSNAIGDGSVGAKQLGDIVVRYGPVVPLPDANNQIAHASCKPGEKVVSGLGEVFAANSPDITTSGTGPESATGTSVPEGQAPAGISVGFTNPAGGTGATNIQASVFCLQ